MILQLPVKKKSKGAFILSSKMVTPENAGSEILIMTGKQMTFDKKSPEFEDFISCNFLNLKPASKCLCNLRIEKTVTVCLDWHKSFKFEDLPVFRSIHPNKMTFYFVSTSPSHYADLKNAFYSISCIGFQDYWSCLHFENWSAWGINRVNMKLEIWEKYIIDIYTLVI